MTWCEKGTAIAILSSVLSLGCAPERPPAAPAATVDAPDAGARHQHFVRHARARLEELGAETERSARRLMDAGDGLERAALQQSLADILHDQGFLRDRLGDVERSDPQTSRHEDLLRLATMIEALAVVSAETAAEVERVCAARRDAISAAATEGAVLPEETTLTEHTLGEPEPSQLD